MKNVGMGFLLIYYSAHVQNHMENKESSPAWKGVDQIRRSSLGLRGSPRHFKVSGCTRFRKKQKQSLLKEENKRNLL